MTDQQFEQLRRRMDEAACLAMDHPDRRSLVREVTSAGGPIEREWLDLLRQDEQLRLELGRCVVPAGLHDRLRRIPDECSRRPSWLFGPPRWAVAIAAGIMLVVGIWLAAARSESGTKANQLESFATVMTAAHQARPELSVNTAQWDRLEGELRGRVPFEITRPAVSPNWVLVGGSTTTLDGGTLVYSRWLAGGRNVSVYQFCAKDFGLSCPLTRRELTPAISKAGPHCRVVIWTQGHCDYALICEPDVDASLSLPRT